MATFDVLERYLRGEYAAVPCAREADYYTVWHERGLDGMAATDAALAGGLLADRLPWVFTAGYQATLRNAFPALPAGGWAAFAATEDTHDRDAHPGTSLVEDADRCMLNGHKSWVAHSRCVDHLIVTVNDVDGDKRRARGLIIERSRSGVTLSHREQPGFLASMSQGFAKFENTPVVPGEVFEFAPIGLFGRTEAKFVMLAAAAFMLARASIRSALQGRLFATSGALLTLLGERETSRQVYAGIDREFQHCVDLFEQQVNTATIVDYAADRRLLRMYTDKIQRRAEYAKQEADA